MATVKKTLSMDAVALSLAERAAELAGTSVSAVVSATLNRHLLTDYAPPPPPPSDPGRLAAAEAAAARADAELAEAADRFDGGRGMRAAG